MEPEHRLRVVGPFPPHGPGTREGFVVVRGEIAVSAGDDRLELSEGDVAALFVDRDHRIFNTGEDEAVVLLLIGRPR